MWKNGHLKSYFFLVFSFSSSFLQHLRPRCVRTAWRRLRGYFHESKESLIMENKTKDESKAGGLICGISAKTAAAFGWQGWSIRPESSWRLLTRFRGLLR